MIRKIIDFVFKIWDILLEIFKWVAEKVLGFISFAWDWFLSLPVFEKCIIFTAIPAIVAVIMPAARFEIFESFFEKNNPLSPYMVLIGFFMFFSIIIRHRRFIPFLRIAFNMYYFGWVVYYFTVPGTITKADGQIYITPYFYLNLIVPVLYSLFAFLSAKTER